MITTSHFPRRTEADRRPSSEKLFFEIRHGRTNFPIRPIEQGRFLIGGGSGCDLRLGGGDVPPLHSIVFRTGDETRLEAVAPSPELRVNGEAISAAVLHDGDVIRIGPMEFVAHFATPRGIAADVSPGGKRASSHIPEVMTETGVDTGTLEDLSAGELVDLIDREHSAVADFDAKTRTGADALLHAAFERAGEPEADGLEPDVGSVSEQELLRRLENAVERLSRYAHAVDVRESRGDARLAARLQSLFDRVSDVDEFNPSSPRSAA